MIKDKIEWEELTLTTRRLPVPGGWLVAVGPVSPCANSHGICFLPDPKHEWLLE